MKNTLLVLHPGVETAETNTVASNESLKAAVSPGRQGSLAPRLSSFKGRRIAVLDNTKVNAVELMTAVAKRLQAHGIAEVRHWRKRHAGESGAQIIPDLLGWKPHLVMTGLGD
mgnify:CR=1 FL=1